MEFGTSIHSPQRMNYNKSLTFYIAQCLGQNVILSNTLVYFGKMKDIPIILICERKYSDHAHMLTSTVHPSFIYKPLVFCGVVGGWSQSQLTLGITMNRRHSQPQAITCMPLDCVRKLENLKETHAWREHPNSTQNGPSRLTGSDPVAVRHQT